MPEMQPDLSHRALMLLDFWFAPRAHPGAIAFATFGSRPLGNSTRRSLSTFAPITIVRREGITGLGGTRRRPASL